MALAQAGEAEIVSCSQCDYAADIEKAVAPTLDMAAEPAKDVELIETPNCATIEDLAKFLSIPLEKTIKAVAFTIDGEKTVSAWYAATIRSTTWPSRILSAATSSNRQRKKN